MTYAIGSLIQARGREWVVLPDSSDDFLLLISLESPGWENIITMHSYLFNNASLIGQD